MGFDVFGNETGYFRANIWYWHPLADYLVEIAPEIMEKVRFLHSNDGDGLGPEDSVALADVLDKEIASGRAMAAVDKWNAKADEIPEEECRLCKGTGKKQDDEVVIRPDPPTQIDDDKCGQCSGTGKEAAFESWFRMDLELIEEFAGFVRKSGGFQIR